MSKFEYGSNVAALNLSQSIPDNDEPSTEQKEQYLKTKRINRKYEEQKKADAEIEKSKNLDLRVIPADFYDELAQQARLIREAQTEVLPFVTPNLTALVPLTYPNLITIGANSGSGKTTTAANITFQLYKNKKRVLILSNEELTLDVLDRISCLELGLNINERASFSVEQQRMLNELRPQVGEYVRVVDTNFAGNPQLTSSIEGIREILHSISKQEKFFDCIILDYYQKVTVSKEDPSQAHHATLFELSNILDRYYKLVMAPLIVIVQLHPISSEHKSFEKRIKAGKSIIMPSTFVLELKRVENEHASEWICHKHRWGNAGKSLKTVWENGQFKDSE